MTANLLGSDDLVISWNAAALTAVEDFSGISWELATGDLCPFGSDMKRKAVTGIFVADDVTLKVPMNDTAGSDFMVLNAAAKAKTECALKAAYGATYYRQLSMTITKANPVPAGGEITMVEFTLVNSGATRTEN